MEGEYVRSDLAGDRRKPSEFKDIESIAIEVTSDGKQWLFLNAYKPPDMNDLSNDFETTTDITCKKYDYLMIMVDLDLNMPDEHKNLVLIDTCGIFYFKNLVKKPTCFTRNAKATLLDVSLIKRDDKCGKICNFGCDFSDVHNMIAVIVKCDRPMSNSKFKNCSSFKNFDEQIFFV